MKTKLLPICCLVVGILTGCAATRPLPPIRLSSPSTEERAMLRQVTKSSLKDPDSARFNDKMVLIDDEAACVEVNAKNTFGGYSGFQQAMLLKLKGVGWDVMYIKNISHEYCIEVLHKVVKE